MKNIILEERILEESSTEMAQKFLRFKCGCYNATEAIKQFQMFVCDLIDDYNPQSEDFDFEMKWHLIAGLTHMQYGVYPSDIRDEILQAEGPNSVYAMMGKLPTDDVQGRMSAECQLTPPIYITPTSTTVYSEELPKQTWEIKMDDDFVI